MLLLDRGSPITRDPVLLYKEVELPKSYQRRGDDVLKVAQGVRAYLACLFV